MRSLANLALMSAMSLAAVGTAGAVPIQFYTTASFTSATGGSIITTTPTVGDTLPNNTVSFTSGPDTIAIRYEDLQTQFVGPGAGPATVNAPTSVGYGFFNIDSSGLTLNGVVNIGGFSIALVIHDLTDGGTTTILGSSAGGQIAQNSSNVNVVWSPNTGVNGPTTWEVDTPTRLVPPNTTIGETTIQGQVTSSLVPEPASMFMMGTGLFAVGFAARRKFSRN
jgi:hypothetical protein